MAECIFGNPKLFNELKKACENIIESRGGSSSVTLERAALIDAEVSLVAATIVDE